MKRFHYCPISAIFLLSFLCLLFPAGIGAQESVAPETVTPGDVEITDEAAEEDQQAAIPNRFREISLGMSLDALKTALQNDSIFNFRGDRDVSFLPAREESLVEISGTSYVKRAFFQLREGSLFIMSFTLNTDMLDHYSLFTGLSAKYGEPSFLGPKETVWETEEIRLALERPLTIKYIDKKVFEDIVNESELIQSRKVQERQEFLDGF